MRGNSQLVNVAPVYGTKGVTADTNTPGGRTAASKWQAADGSLWLYGGDIYSSSGVSYPNDLWKFNLTTNQWTWMGGSTTANRAAAYYTSLGVAAPQNNPGSRSASSSWIDASDKLWLFGGYNGAGNALNDLWKFDPATGYWTAVQANGYGTNKPAVRYHCISWKDTQANLWIFGGYITTRHLNDLWKLTTNTGTATTYYQDYDKDGFGNAAVKITTSCAAPSGYVVNNTDCNDKNAAINPGKAEVVGNKIDDDCDGAIDEAALTNAITVSKQSDKAAAEAIMSIAITAAPNPASQYFTLAFKSTSSKPAQLRVVDEMGRAIETRNAISANSAQTIGHTYRSGMYYVEVLQEGKKATVKLIKLGAL